MSEAYERERQNNARLESLSSKVTALRGVTVDIYDNARAQDVIDNTVRSKSIAFFLSAVELFTNFVIMVANSLPPLLVRYIHIHGIPSQRLGKPINANGRLGKQHRYIKAIGHHHRGVSNTLLRHQMDLLRQSASRAK
jgi:blocked-early-in-transport protein 1